MYKKVLVTGATGNIAGYIIPQLSAKGISVNAYVHHKSKADKIKMKGVEIFEGNYTDQNTLNAAAKGTDAVVSITPLNANAVPQATAILKAAKSASVKCIVRISAMKAGKDAPTANGRMHSESETEIISSGIPYTILRPHFFMQNLMMSVPTIANKGNIYWAMGTGKLGMIDVRDIADCVVSILTNGGHEGKTYNPTGPASIDFNEVATIMSDKMGKKITNVNVPYEEISKAIVKMGGDKWVGDVMADYSKAFSSNWGNFTNDDVKKLTGHKPRSFQQFFDEIMSFALNQVHATTH